MASKDSKADAAQYRSVSGQAETAEPSSSHNNNNNNNAAAATASDAKQQTPSRQSTVSTQSTQGTPSSTQKSSQSSISTAPTPTLRKSSSSNLAPLTTPSTGQSPRTSRNTSPIRKDNPPTLSGNLSTQPSAAAIQRALSASSVQQLQQSQQPRPTQPAASSTTDPVSRKAREQKSASASGANTPSWPISPRLKSPPPSGNTSRRGSTALQKRPESVNTPSISVHSATPRDGSAPEASSQRPEQGLQPQPSASKAPSRGPSGKSILETVQENSSDILAEPSAAATQASADLKPLTKISDEQKSSSKRPEGEGSAQPGESGSESTGNKSDGKSRSRRASVNQPTSAPPKPKNLTLKANYPQSAKRHSEGKQGMVVETEIVPSIPQSALSTGERSARLDGGSVRLKPSNETIRPKKERKKADRKARSVNQGSATSKADLFEARVASAIDDASTSDSEDTFVYESNPPEPPRRQRHHSRTPSVTSSHSIADQQRGGMRGFGDPFEDRRVAGKRSMKFSSNPYTELDSPDSRDGTVRSHTPRHIGRFGRGGHHPHSASYDPDSPFTQAQKGRTHQLSAHARSRPTSPRSPQSMQYRPSGLFGKKSEQAYDFDAEQVADDEQTPLLGTVRGGRGSVRSSRRHDPETGRVEVLIGDEPRPWYRPTSGCALLTVVVVVIGLLIALFFASNHELDNVRIHKIQNVLASEQELMFDLLVGAVNPNIMCVSIDDMNINVFAKSKHLGGLQTFEIEGRRMKRRRSPAVSDYNPNPSQDLSGHWHAPQVAPDSHDHGTDPPPDEGEEKETQAMLLGRVLSFDQALSFGPSPFAHNEHSTSGQVRLMQPGNHTETGGSDRWERILQHPFELIVRGTLKYQLPVSGRGKRAVVSASIIVHPEEGLDRNGNMRTEPVEDEHDEEWWERQREMAESWVRGLAERA